MPNYCSRLGACLPCVLPAFGCGNTTGPTTAPLGVRRLMYLPSPCCMAQHTYINHFLREQAGDHDGERVRCEQQPQPQPQAIAPAKASGISGQGCARARACRHSALPPARAPILTTLLPPCHSASCRLFLPVNSAGLPACPLLTGPWLAGRVLSLPPLLSGCRRPGLSLLSPPPRPSHALASGGPKSPLGLGTRPARQGKAA